MNKILSRIFDLLKYVLLVLAFGVTLYGMIMTYRRLEKDLVEAIPTLLPFVILLITFFANLFIKSPVIKDNLLYNFTAVVALGSIIIIGLRAKFDTNMLLYYKYKIDYNPLYLSDNLAAIKLMLYTLSGANVLFMLSAIFDRKKKKAVVVQEVSEPQKVQEFKKNPEVKEVRETQETHEVKKYQEVEEPNEVPEVKEVEKFQDMPEPEKVEDAEETHDMQKNESVQDIL